MAVADMRAALVAIQELHKPMVFHGYDGEWLICGYCDENHPCETRKLADDGLAGGQDV